MNNRNRPTGAAEAESAANIKRAAKLAESIIADLEAEAKQRKDKQNKAAEKAAAERRKRQQISKKKQNTGKKKKAKTAEDEANERLIKFFEIGMKYFNSQKEG